jgi:hypothetical protein
MSNNDPYLISRKNISDNWDNVHLLEVNGLCPLCGNYLLKQKDSRMNKNYEIAHIYPNSPNPHQLNELANLERLGNNCEDFENKISLCKICHGNYDSHTTKAEYLNLLNIKKKLLALNNSKVTLSSHDLEPEIENILKDISIIESSELDKLELSYDALRIAEKIPEDSKILKNKIETYVCIYYKFIKQQFRYLENSNKLNFNLIATSMKLAFLKCENGKTKSEIFDSLVDWLMSKTGQYSRETYEVIISFFVQNCEVFDEISK